MTKEYVIILHGIMRSKFHMRKLEAFLTLNNYEVLNINYPSYKHGLETLAISTWQEIEPKILEASKVHFVGYSIGCY